MTCLRIILSPNSTKKLSYIYKILKLPCVKLLALRSHSPKVSSPVFSIYFEFGFSNTICINYYGVK